MLSELQRQQCRSSGQSDRWEVSFACEHLTVGACWVPKACGLPPEAWAEVWASVLVQACGELLVACGPLLEAWGEA